MAVLNELMLMLDASLNPILWYLNDLIAKAFYFPQSNPTLSSDDEIFQRPPSSGLLYRLVHLFYSTNI